MKTDQYRTVTSSLLVFFDPFTDPNPPPEFYINTSTPTYLAPLVERWLATLRPDLNPPVCHNPLEAIYLDAHGPVYSAGRTRVTTKRGYSVECPDSHVDVVVANLRELPRAAEFEGMTLSVYHNYATLAVLPWDDVEEIATLLEPYVAQAREIRQAFVARSQSNPHYEYRGL